MEKTNKAEYMKGLSLRSEEVQEIMSKPPHWMLRWGITTVAVIVIAMMVGSYLIRNEETQPMEVFIESNISDIDILADEKGDITRMFVKNGDVVSKGDTLFEYKSNNRTTPHDSFCFITTPTTGTVSFPSYRNKGICFEKGELLLSIKSQDSHAVQIVCYGFIDKGLRNKVSKGQLVKIKTASDGKTENNVLTGRIIEISILPNDKNTYFIEIALPKVEKEYFLQNNSERKVRLEGEVVTERPRLINKFFSSIRSL